MADNGFSIVQTQQHDAGLPGSSVFTAWKNAPASGKASEAAVKARSVTTGSSVAASQDVLGQRYANRDFYRDANDTASIV